MRDFCECGGMYQLAEVGDRWVFTCNNCRGMVELSDRDFRMDANPGNPVG